jgi:hypothetical protein
VREVLVLPQRPMSMWPPVASPVDAPVRQRSCLLVGRSVIEGLVSLKIVMSLEKSFRLRALIDLDDLPIWFDSAVSKHSPLLISQEWHVEILTPKPLLSREVVSLLEAVLAKTLLLLVVLSELI